MTTTTTTKTTKRPRGRKLGAAQRTRYQDAFLTEFAECGLIRRACRIAGISRTLVYEWRAHDPDFAARYKLAREDADDVIRGEIHRRGVDGWDEPVYQGGQKVGVIRRYSDNMLKLLAQSRMQEYRDKLDVTSGNEALGAHGSIEKIINDPDAAALACDLVERVGQGATPERDAGGTGAAGE